MPLVKVNELLHHATENGYGVAAVNVFNYETIKWVAEAANRCLLYTSDAADEL